LVFSFCVVPRALALPCPLCRRDVRDWTTCCNKCVASLLGLVFVSHLVTSDERTLQKVTEGTCFAHPASWRRPGWTASVRSTVVRSSRASPSPFEGCGVEEGREQVAQCCGMTLATPHNVGDGRTVAGYLHSARTGFVGAVRDSVWRGFVLWPGRLQRVRAFNALVGRNRWNAPGRGEASSEAETRSRGTSLLSE
jgi:hypothetical protein